MTYEYPNYFYPRSAGAYMKDVTGQQILQITHSGGVTYFKGADATTDDLYIYSNSTDTYPYIKLPGKGNIQYLAQTNHIFYNQAAQKLYIAGSVANETKIQGGGVTGDDIDLNCNTVDSLPRFKLWGNNYMNFDIPSGQLIRFRIDTTAFLQYEHSGTDAIIESAVSNDDLYLKTNGTGVIKFGTHAAITTETLTGYITIKDSGGNSRKIGVVS